ncbi:MAG TPA: hypothetical protein VF762_23330 [Blastocatellia bacterium]
MATNFYTQKGALPVGLTGTLALGTGRDTRGKSLIPGAATETTDPDLGEPLALLPGIYYYCLKLFSSIHFAAARG